MTYKPHPFRGSENRNWALSRDSAASHHLEAIGRSQHTSLCTRLELLPVFLLAKLMGIQVKIQPSVTTGQ
jgi:hypothetical protein